MKLVALLLGIQLSVGLRVAAPATLKCTRGSFLHAAGLSLLVPPAAHAEVFSSAGDCTGTGICSSNAKTQLASFIRKYRPDVGENPSVLYKLPYCDTLNKVPDTENYDLV